MMDSRGDLDRRSHRHGGGRAGCAGHVDWVLESLSFCDRWLWRGDAGLWVRAVFGQRSLGMSGEIEFSFSPPIEQTLRPLLRPLFACN